MSWNPLGEAELPLLDDGGKRARLILGTAYGERSPVEVFSEMLYLDVILDPGASIPLPKEHEDRGAYVSHGSIEIAGQEFDAGRMMVFRPGDAISIRAGEQGARLMLLGGETLRGPRYIWWNFVASSRELIQEAKRAWAEREEGDPRFVLPPGDEDEFIPLPRR